MDAALTSGTAAEIICAAERLFAARGILGVSLREVTRAAGQRNTTSLQYHFGDREGLLRALMAKHMNLVATRRDALLDHCVARGDLSLGDSAAVLVRPLMAKLVDPDGGPEFLQIAAELLHRTQRRVDRAEPVGLLIYDSLGSLERWSEVFDRLMPAGSVGAPLHRRFAVIRFVHLELGRRARIGPPIDDALFGSQLIDLVSGLIAAELSDETQQLLADRPDRPERPERRDAAQA